MSRQPREISDTPVDYQWKKKPVMAFVTFWGQRGDTLWVSSTYTNDHLEMARGRWGITHAGAKNPNNWMERVNFDDYTDSVYAVTDAEGYKKMQIVDDAVSTIEKQIADLHLQLLKATKERTQTFREVAKDHGVLVAAKDLKDMRDFAHSFGRGHVAKFEATPPVDK